MDVSELLTDLFGRVDEHVHTAVDGLAPEGLTTAVVPGSNPIGWLVWHLARVEDDHVSELLGVRQAWVDGDWGQRFGIDTDPHDTRPARAPVDLRPTVSTPRCAATRRWHRDSVRVCRGASTGSRTSTASRARCGGSAG